MGYKIVTFSLDTEVIAKLEKLKDYLHNPNKSGILTLFIEAEYKRQILLREDEDD